MLGLRQLVSACCSASLLVTMSVLADRFSEQREVRLQTAGIAVDAAGHTVEVGSADQLAGGSRVLIGATAQLARQQRWAASGSVPEVAGVDPALFSDALLDLDVLTQEYGVTVAGWTPSWRYVWPRDSAMVVSAFARTGHRREAEALLTFLQSSQGTDGLFQARYRPDQPGVAPDERGVQFDGTGWALWGLAELARRSPAADRAGYAATYRQLLDRSTYALLHGVDPATGLPYASPDYWETSSRVTLATAAVTLAGLRSAAYLYRAFGLPAPDGLDPAADRLHEAIVAAFGPDGYPRTVGGSARSVDLGVTFLLQPIGDASGADVLSAWRRAPRFMARPAGGLAPGGSWRDDGISWTPTVGSYAMAAACVDPSVARHWLDWLAAHRTSTGSLPEKVRADGSPASVAPLAWTAAAVLIAGDELQHGC